MEAVHNRVEVDENYSQLLGLLVAIRNLCGETAAGQIKDNPRWSTTHDIRITVFWNLQAVIDGSMFLLAFAKDKRSQRDLVTRLFHFEPTGRAPVSSTDYSDKHMEQVLKVGFIQILFSVTESAMRTLLRAIDATKCHGATSEFASVYSCLLGKLALSARWTEMLDLFREIRNVVHNNGVYRHKSRQVHKLSYRGKEYVFENGKAIQFAHWNLFLQISLDIHEMFSVLVTHVDIRGIPTLIADDSQPNP